MKTLTDDEAAALLAIRSVVADAFNHPGRNTAIRVLDRMRNQGEWDHPGTTGGRHGR